jgi:glycosyltransferase involved in cell wall biosynthesis
MAMIKESETKKVCMIAYTQYKYDHRIHREAETLAGQDGYHVSLIVPKEDYIAKIYKEQGVEVRELNMQQYQGKHKRKYIASYVKFMIRAFFVCQKLLWLRQVDIFHIHNMPNFLVFSAVLARLWRKKLILDIHDSVPETYAAKFNENRNKILFWLLCCEEALCCRLVHKIICVNHPQRDVLVNRGINPEKITISMNGIRTVIIVKMLKNIRNILNLFIMELSQKGLVWTLRFMQFESSLIRFLRLNFIFAEEGMIVRNLYNSLKI